MRHSCRPHLLQECVTCSSSFSLRGKRLEERRHPARGPGTAASRVALLSRRGTGGAGDGGAGGGVGRGTDGGAGGADGADGTVLLGVEQYPGV